MKGKSQTRIEK